MSNLDLFRMGIKNLWRRKLRTFLTVLGVIIGASSIIVMLSLGFGMSKSFEEQIAQWGSLTTINVQKSWVEQPGQKQAVLDDKAVASFKLIPNVAAVSPMLEAYGSIINGRYLSNAPIRGIDPDSMEAFGFEVAEGRLLSKNDELTVVFGGRMKDSFYEPKSRVWREPKINLMKDRMTLTLDPNYGWSSPGEKKPSYKEYKIKVAGVLTEGDWQTGYGIYMPITEVQKLLKEKEKAENQKPQPGRKKETGYNKVDVKVNDMKNVQEVQKQIKEMGYEAYSLNDELESMKKQAAVIQAVLGGIGAVSLLVAAIGITNTMVMSIYERTKEIGVMKVIGASLKDIKRLFLFESALIGLTGGVFGVGFSYLISFLINKFSGQFGQAIGAYGATKISIIPIWLIFAAMAFSALIGIMSGYFPARRAMNLSALEAIRTE
ncbi:ABC transporter permease [Tissierella carlieri]|jgi:ABC-type antimicrobial peptide transport system permease subunit|uniref:ABC transporter permease n=1 Tax=Tissierella TaxID=41273 RepID=UPI001C111104|nr:ABC transporter permease [Tissierella carlieri]MBU5312389.1 ABC transporter permease [Tissierella carlieri]